MAFFVWIALMVSTLMSLTSATGPVGRPQILNARHAAPVALEEAALRDAAVRLLDAH